MSHNNLTTGAKRLTKIGKHTFVDRFKLEVGLFDQARFSPFLVQLVVTRRCNLKCGYCNEFDNVSEPVPTQVLKQRINKVYELGIAPCSATKGLWTI